MVFLCYSSVLIKLLNYQATYIGICISSLDLNDQAKDRVVLTDDSRVLRQGPFGSAWVANHSNQNIGCSSIQRSECVICNNCQLQTNKNRQTFHNCCFPKTNFSNTPTCCEYTRIYEQYISNPLYVKPRKNIFGIDGNNDS